MDLVTGRIILPALAAAVLLSAAGASPQADGAKVVTIPIKTATQTVGETITVCMYRGARPSPYRVVRSSCRGGADYCTAHIALGEEEADMVVTSYDLDYPPVEATGPTCDQPAPPPTGVLPPGEHGPHRAG